MNKKYAINSVTGGRVASARHAPAAAARHVSWHQASRISFLIFDTHAPTLGETERSEWDRTYRPIALYGGFAQLIEKVDVASRAGRRPPPSVAPALLKAPVTSHY
ncbi:unnamed protein product [Colias eurytheme]|nr:unnamed protein product [Colias eurytheme]